MESLGDAGKVLYVGSSNFAGWHIVQANETARQRHFLGLVSEQCKYNLLHRMVELEVLPACRQYGLGVLPWSPLAGGLLAGDVAAAAGGRRSEKWVREGFEKHRRSVESFWALCREIGQKPADVALAWVLASPAVTAPIIGPRTIEQLDDSARALELKLSDDTMKKLDGIFPGPGGAAPEAWAW
jgi:aryl-alcohol dehydrogenase-like predicted oxidoreductase